MYMSYNPYNSNVKVEWEYIGEGLEGYYDENDPDDKELLRFSVCHRETRNDDFVQVENASYCTAVELNTDPIILKKLLRYIWKEVHDPVTNGNSIKGLCEELSWLDSVVETELHTVETTPEKKLPLLIGSLQTEEGQEALQKRLKGES